MYNSTRFVEELVLTTGSAWLCVYLVLCVVFVVIPSFVYDTLTIPLLAVVCRCRCTSRVGWSTQERGRSRQTRFCRFSCKYQKLKNSTFLIVVSRMLLYDAHNSRVHETKRIKIDFKPLASWSPLPPCFVRPRQPMYTPKRFRSMDPPPLLFFFCKPQTRGYDKDSKIKIEDVEKLFADTGKTKYVKICKAGGSKLSECVGGTPVVTRTSFRYKVCISVVVLQCFWWGV